MYNKKFYSNKNYKKEKPCLVHLKVKNTQDNVASSRSVEDLL